MVALTVTASCQLQPSLYRYDSHDNPGCYVPDYLFRCSYCIKLIAEDAPVYMQCDHSYCSSVCRDKGLSRLYTNLKEKQLQEGMSRPSVGSLATSGNWKSDSSICSRATHRIGLEEGGNMIARITQKVLDVMLQRVASGAWGRQMLQTYSSGMLWGREFTKNSSVSAMFNYLPEVDRYLEPSLDADNSFDWSSNYQDEHRGPSRLPSTEYINDHITEPVAIRGS